MPGSCGAEESESDSEERPQEHEVREIREMDDVRAEPADERQLQEQHERAREQQAPSDRHWRTSRRQVCRLFHWRAWWQAAGFAAPPSYSAAFRRRLQRPAPTSVAAGRV